MRRLLFLFVFVLLTISESSAQTAVQDSVRLRVVLLKELVAAQNFERAQVEAEDFRWLLRRERLLVPNEAIPLVAAIYFENKDKLALETFLAEAERDARRQAEIEDKALIYKTLIATYEKCEQPTKALAAQRNLAVAQDSLAARRVTAEAIRWRRQLDSLANLRQVEQASRADFLQFEKSKVVLVAGLVGGLILLLLFWNFFAAARFRKKMIEKDEEVNFLRSDRFVEANLPPAEKMDEKIAPSAVAPSTAARAEPQEFIPHRPGEIWTSPQKTALVIEPNRKIVIYLKTLLADEFEVHSCYTPYEGLAMAAELLPDLVVCDAILNGKTGTEVIREIKFDQRTNHIPVLMLTEKSGQEAKLDAMGAGADLYFPRPMIDTEVSAQIKLLFGVQKSKHKQFSRALHLYFTDHRVNTGEPFLEKTMAYIEAHLHEPEFTSEVLSQKMQLSKFHFQKKLFALTGREAVQLLREMRMEKAKIMLERRLAPPPKVAELVGYLDTGTFSRNFKEYFGDNTILMQGYKVNGLLSEEVKI